MTCSVLSCNVLACVGHTRFCHDFPVMFWHGRRKPWVLLPGESRWTRVSGGRDAQGGREVCYQNLIMYVFATFFPGVFCDVMLRSSGSCSVQSCSVIGFWGAPAGRAENQRICSAARRAKLSNATHRVRQRASQRAARTLHNERAARLLASRRVGVEGLRGRALLTICGPNPPPCPLAR